jgi:hypothetical protein
LPGSDAPAIRRRYSDLLQRCLGTVTGSQIDVSPPSSGGRQVWTVEVPEPLPAADIPGGVRLRATEQFQLRQDWDRFTQRDDWRIVVTSYSYVVSGPAEDLLAWCWFPHAPAEAEPRLWVRRDWAEFPLPTGHIRLTSVLRLLLAEFRAPAQRSDWQVVLGDADLEFAAHSRFGLPTDEPAWPTPDPGDGGVRPGRGDWFRRG